MRIVFFGSAHFAVPSLSWLVKSGADVACVLTQPDRKRGRGLHLAHTSIKSTALEHKLNLYQPEQVNTDAVKKALCDFEADIFIVIAYGQILSKSLLEIPKLMAINLHASLLPEYRGAAPINWSLVHGDAKTGVTVIKMTQKMDAGPIILQMETGITEEDNAITLEDKLSKLAVSALQETMQLIKDKKFKLLQQDEGKVSFAPKMKKNDGLINWQNSSVQIHNLIRGCVGWPGAYSFYKGKLIKIYQAKILLEPDPDPSAHSGRLPGEISHLSKHGLAVKTADGCILIERLQPSGGRIMDAGEFISGHKISTGGKFG